MSTPIVNKRFHEAPLARSREDMEVFNAHIATAIHEAHRRVRVL